MSRGVVLWPDPVTSERVSDIWRDLEDAGLPSLSTLTHRRHRPHVSLVVARHLDPQPALEAIGLTPRSSIPLVISSVGVFPGEGAATDEQVLFLAVVANQDLLVEQQSVSQAIAPLTHDPWDHFEPGGWTAHVTLGVGYSVSQLGEAVPLVLRHLPLIGTLDRGGVEDGDTGESWPSLRDAAPTDSRL